LITHFSWFAQDLKTLNNISWLIHMNNARLQNSGRAQRCVEASRAESLPHLAYSPDLALNEFFLFGYIKGNLSE
jgi:predicted amino acid racemase